MKAIIGGWDITWIFKYNTGVPLVITPYVNYPGWEGAVYANWDCTASLAGTFDPKAFNPGVQNAPANLYFNRAAFSNPTNHTLGNGMRRYEQLRGFGYSNEDVGLMKYWHLGSAQVCSSAVSS